MQQADFYEEQIHDDETPEPVGKSRQLRLALAMRGGVSLAVWIGGAVSEIERLRQLQDPLKPKPDSKTDGVCAAIYRKLLEVNGFDDVIVDVLSGASAGGMNGAVYAAAQVHGFSIDKLAGLWTELGDIELLARDTTAGGRAKSAREVEQPLTRSQARLPPSLLRGDEYFYTELREVLDKLVGEANGDGTPEPDSGAEQGVQPAAASKVTKAERINLLLASTLFNPAPIKKFVNRRTIIEETRSKALFRFGHDEAKTDETDFDESPASNRRLAMAARATSSFPFAFEFAKIHAGTDATSEIDQIDFTDIFDVPSRNRAGEYKVIDGGVLDNIPVGAAISAVVEAPASGPTERWLCYLHPSPVRPREEEEDDSSRSPRGVATLLRTFAARFSQESLLEDIDELGQVNELAKRRELARETILAPFGDDGHEALRHDIALADKAASVRAILSQFESIQVRSALERAELGQEDGDDGLIRDVSSWPPEIQTALRDGLLAAHQSWFDGDFSEHIVSPKNAITFQREATSLLIAYARKLETGRDGLASAVKTKLYEFRSALNDALDTEERRWLDLMPSSFSSAEDVGPWAANTLASIKSATSETEGEGDAEFDFDERWGELVDLTKQLNNIDGERETPFSLLHAAPPEEVDAVLEALVLTLLPVLLLGTGPWNPVKFVYLHGNAPTSLPFPGNTESAPLTAAEKLAGNDLANFSAFLSATWRANDWMWGRLDAASTLIEALCGPNVLDDPASRSQLITLAGLDESNPNAEDPEIIAAIRDRVQTEIFHKLRPKIENTPHSAIDPEKSHAPSVEEYRIGEQSVSSLSETRRTRVGMRMAHLTYAVLRPSGSAASDRAIRLVTSILKPFYLVMVFALLAPARSLLALAFAASGLQLTFWRGQSDPTLTWDRSAAAVVLVAAMGGLVWIGRRRWIANKKRSLGNDSWIDYSSVIAAISGVALLVLLFREAGERYLALGFVNLSIIGTSARNLWSRRAKLESWATAYWAGAITVAAVGLILGWLDTPLLGQQTDDRIWVMIGAAVVVTVLVSSWMHPPYVVAAAVLTIAVALGSLSITDRADDVVLVVDARGWLWIGIALLLAIYARDVWLLFRNIKRRDESPKTPGESRLALLPAALTWLGILGTIGGILTLSDFAAPLGTWAWVAVIAVSYANVALTTYQPVFTKPEKLKAEDCDQRASGNALDGCRPPDASGDDKSLRWSSID